MTFSFLLIVYGRIRSSIPLYTKNARGKDQEFLFFATRIQKE
jgi:hypothetical protein